MKKDDCTEIRIHGLSRQWLMFYIVLATLFGGAVTSAAPQFLTNQGAAAQSVTREEIGVLRTRLEAVEKAIDRFDSKLDRLIAK